MSRDSSDQSGVPPVRSYSTKRSPKVRRSNGRLARIFMQPLVLAVLAVLLGTAVGLGGYLATRSEKGPTGQRARSDSPKFDYVGIQNKHPPKLPSPGMHLAFDGTFTGSSLDTQVWDTCFWYSAQGSGCTHSGVY